MLQVFMNGKSFSNKFFYTYSFCKVRIELNQSFGP